MANKRCTENQMDFNGQLLRDTSINGSIPSLSNQDETNLGESALLGIRLNIVIQTIGTRGDIQPFLFLGDELLRHGHRVRIATHAMFATTIATGHPRLEFFPIGGDPGDLISYGQKNTGFVHELKTLQARLQGKKIPIMSDIISGCWRSCVEDDPISGAPFVADVIIASPIGFSHVHCAQALGGVPVHLMYSMPWSWTRKFPHAITSARMGRAMKPSRWNGISYTAIEWMMWLYLGDTINQLRDSLGLGPVPMELGPGLHETLKIPFAYFWPPALVPKADDWAGHIDVCGYMGSTDMPPYEPSPELQEFLHSGATPVYIGFGSITLDGQESQELTDTVLASISLAGIRAVVGKGWCKLGGFLKNSKDVFFIDDCPHEWLFQHVSAVVHHGGLGTTVYGLTHGRPTVIVPFVADQHFWGRVVAGAGAGPAPIPYTSLNPRRLTAAIRYCFTNEAQASARELGIRLRAETPGSVNAARSFHQNLPMRQMRCDYLHDQPAMWSYMTSKREIQLSKAAASVLISHGRVHEQHLKMHRIKVYGALESGTSHSLMNVMIAVFVAVLSALLCPIIYLLRRHADVTDSTPEAPKDCSTQTTVIQARLREGQKMLQRMPLETQSAVLQKFDATFGRDQNTCECSL